LKNQKIINRQIKTAEKELVFDASNVRIRVWIPTLERARVEYRDMRQTRHSFATYHLSRGKNPLQIANVMGHRNAEMVIKVYSKYIENAVGLDD